MSAEKHRPVVGVDYPRLTGEFPSWLGSDVDYRDCLQWLRWPAGFLPAPRRHRRVADPRWPVVLPFM